MTKIGEPEVFAARVAEKWARQKGEFAPPGQRGGQKGRPQHQQLPSAKREDARRYKSTPKTKRDSRMYYHLVCKRKPNCMQRREEYRQNPDKYKRKRAPLREAAQDMSAADIILFDRENPSNREIKQPGNDVGYEATSPTHYQKSPDKKDGVPPSHDLPNQHHDDANPATSRVIPDSMGENLRDNLTYSGGSQHINAAAINLRSLPQGLFFLVSKTSTGGGGWKITVNNREGEKVAYLSMSRPLGVGPCLGAYEVQNVYSAIKGLGPLLYDLALEIAGKRGLMSDRREVSSSARRVWDYYLNNRPDIRWKQLDDFYGSLNNDPEDDCKNSSAGVAWLESSLSKVYYTSGTRLLDGLKSLGVLREGEEAREKPKPPVSSFTPEELLQMMDEEESNMRFASKKKAALIADIFSKCAPELLKKSKGVQYSRKAIRPNGMTVWVASGSKGESYTIRVKPVPKSKSHKVVEKMPVQVSCSCPFFRWQGPEHWAKTNDYLYGKPEGSAAKPNKKDPNGKHWACKHVLAVLDQVRKQRFAGASGYSWDGDLQPFSDSVYSPRRVFERWSSTR